MSRKAWILLLAVAAIWGIPYLFIAIAVDELSPLVVAFGRTALAALVLLPLALRTGALRGLRERGGWLVILAGVQMAWPFAVLGYAEERIPSSLTGLLVSSAPLFVALLSASERGGAARLGGLGLGFAGVGVLLGADLGGDLVGGGLAVSAALGYALAALLLKRRFGGADGLGVVAWTTTLSAAMLAVPAALTLPSDAPSAGAAASVAVLGTLCTAVGFLLFFRLNAAVGPGRSSIVAYIAPVFAVFFGVAFREEAFGLSTAAGLALVLGGSWLAATGPRPLRRFRTARSSAVP